MPRGCSVFSRSGPVRDVSVEQGPCRFRAVPGFEHLSHHIRSGFEIGSRGAIGAFRVPGAVFVLARPG